MSGEPQRGTPKCAAKQGSHGQISRRQAWTARCLLRAVLRRTPDGPPVRCCVDRGHPGLPSWTWVAAVDTARSDSSSPFASGCRRPTVGVANRHAHSETRTALAAAEGTLLAVVPGLWPDRRALARLSRGTRPSPPHRPLIPAAPAAGSRGPAPRSSAPRLSPGSRRSSGRPRTRARRGWDSG